MGVADGVVRLRIQGSDHGCHSTGQKLKAAVEEALADKAPDAAAIEIEEAAAATGPAVAFVPLEELVRKNGRQR